MIKSFKIFESYNEIRSICDRYHVENWELNPETGLVDVFGDVGLQYCSLKKLPLKFGIVSGGFYCYNNQLASLEGAPQNVGGYFYCYNNQLTSLEGAPKSVGRDFYCYNNKLTSLVGAPKSIGGDFNCGNNKLTSLVGAPHSVAGEFWCHNNQIRDFKVPEYSLNEEEQFVCRENPIFEIYKLFNTPKCIDLINEYGAIGDGIVSRVKLEEVFLELGMEVPNLKIDFHASKNWKLV